MSIPQLSLCLSRSPLLPSLLELPAQDDHLTSIDQLQLVPSLLAKRSLNLVGDSATILFAPSSVSSLASYASSMVSLPACAPTQPLATSSGKPLPPLPQRLSSNAITAFLDLLRILDKEVASEVARISMHIQEARVSIDAYKVSRAESENNLGI